MNKKGSFKSNYIIYIFILLTIICEIFKSKNIFLESNKILEISISNILYPITFLITILIYKKSDFKETHKNIIRTSTIILLFMLIISIFNTIPGNYISRETDLALKQIFTPNFILIKKFPIYYPDLLNLITFTLLFYFSHTLILILYEAMEPYTKKFIAFGLAMFIPLTLDVICYVSINNIFDEIEFPKMITNLTSNFVIVIISTILMTIIYQLLNRKKIN